MGFGHAPQGVAQSSFRTAECRPVKALLARLLSNPQPVRASLVEDAPTAPVELCLRPDVAFPVPDWDQVERAMAHRFDCESADSLWTAAARQWLLALASWAGAGFQVLESEHFLALSGQSPRIAQATLAYCERTRARILRLLDGIAATAGFGKPCVLVFDDVEAYYRYVSHYYPWAGEYALSSGLYINQGYGHFVVGQNDLNAIEPVIAHELTHLHLAHLQLPTWLNEGLAVGVEAALAPPRIPAGRRSDSGLQHRDYWNPQRLQRFWSGEAFVRAGAVNALAYDLAGRLTRLLGDNRAAFTAFANNCRPDDAGESAARTHCGAGLGDFAAVLLGEGDWAPHPERWPGPQR